MTDNLVIKNEEDAWDALKQALSEQINETANVVFEGWPVFQLTIEGKDFKGTIPTRVMPPILDLQKEIHRIYCKAKYNTEDVRRLRDDERELLELVVSIKPGSTKFVTKLFKALNEIIKNSNMNGNQAVILLVSISAIIATSIGWKDWVSSKEREHGQDVSVKLSEQETARLKLVADALTKDPSIEKNKESISEFKNDLSRRLKPSDNLKIDEQPLLTGVRASEITSKPRQVAEEKRLDGEFLINEVKFPKQYGGEYRFSVTRVIDRQTMQVDAAPGALTDEQITILKDGGFGVKRVLMEINAKELRGRITSAKLVSIQWPEPEK